MTPLLSSGRLSSNPLRTRSDLQDLARDLVAPLLPHFSPGRTRVELAANRAGYGDPASLLEGYSRPLWGLAPLAAGGGRFAHWELWREGLINGTNPKHPEYWGPSGDYDQRSVEQAAFGLALALAPGEFWKPLSAEERTRVAAWLNRIHEVKLARNNWVFFRVIVQVGLRAVGEAWVQETLEADLAQLDTYYLRDGWYADGLDGEPWKDGRTGDYYNPMAFHFYGLLYARLASAHDPARAARYVERARLFAREFQHYFSPDGDALPFGRSLTYRFAQGAFWGALAFAGVEALPWPVIKGIYLRHLRWWLRQPIFTETGLLTIGYAYPNLYLSENYNSPGSPYWAMKALLPLALPASHPFWKAEEAPLPPRPAVLTSRGAKLVLTTDAKTRDVTALNPGQRVLEWPRNAPAKYSKFTYGMRFAFTVPVGAAVAHEGGFDGGLALGDDERFFRARDFARDAEAGDGVAYSRWSPWPDVEVRTWLIAAPEDGGHVRVHRVKTARTLWSLEGGFAVPYRTKTDARQETARAGRPVVRASRGASALRELLGDREGRCQELAANSHLLESLSAMPTLRGRHEPGEFWLACWCAGAADPEADFAGGASYAVDVGDAALAVRRNGEPWWRFAAEAAVGVSSPSRLDALRTLV